MDRFVIEGRGRFVSRMRGGLFQWVLGLAEVVYDGAMFEMLARERDDRSLAVD